MASSFFKHTEIAGENAASFLALRLKEFIETTDRISERMRLYPLASEWVRYCRSSSSAGPSGSIDCWWFPRRNEIFIGKSLYLLRMMFHPLSTHSPSLNFSHSTVWNPEMLGIPTVPTSRNFIRKCNIDPTSFIPAVTTDFRLKKSFLYTFHQRSRYPFWMHSALCPCLTLIGVLEWQTRVSSTLNANQDQRKLARPITIAF